MLLLLSYIAITIKIIFEKRFTEDGNRNNGFENGYTATICGELKNELEENNKKIKTT